MQASGNDYVFVDHTEFQPFENYAEVAESVAIRRLSIGSDGLVVLLPSKNATVKMRIFNADGSEGKTCGNALRCIGKYLYERRLKKEKAFTVETLSGVKTLRILDGAAEVLVCVDMGAASFSPESVPVLSESAVVSRPYTVGESTLYMTCVSVGNPHAVFIVDDFNGLDIDGIGKLVESDGLFPDKTNVEFVRVLNSREIAVKVWERGSGRTLACGSGACASVAACAINGVIDRLLPIKVNLEGGCVVVRTDEDYRLKLEGGAKFVFEGEYEYFKDKRLF